MIRRPPSITEFHLSRLAIIYSRQSSEAQRERNVGSTALQHDAAEIARAWEWPEELIDNRDSDLSADRPGTRDELNRTIDDMWAGRVGAVFFCDQSRIGRNEEDQGRFLYAARMNNVRLVIDTQAYDLSEPNVGFTVGILGHVAVREHQARKQFGNAARRKKAELGLAPTRCPVGYERTPNGRQKHSDEQVEERVQFIWSKALQLRSARKVLRFLREQRLKMPRNAKDGKIEWVEATWSRILAILKNPAYAGTYIYGMTRVAIVNGRQRPVPVPPDQWIVKENNHPSYVSREQFDDLQAALARNAFSRCGPAGRGNASFQGMLTCAKHQRHRLQVNYHERTRMLDGSLMRAAKYVCRPKFLEGDCRECFAISARILDPFVERELLQTLSPIALDNLKELARYDQLQYETLCRIREDEITRATRHAARLEETYVELPRGTDRRVRERLRERWAAAERRLEELKLEYERRPVMRPTLLDESAVEELRHLLSRLEDVWRHPLVSAEKRKTLIRAVIGHIEIAATESDWELTIQWVAGAKTHHRIPTSAGVTQIVEDDHRQGYAVSDIVQHLAAVGAVRVRGSHFGEPYDADTVWRIVRRIRWAKKIDEQIHEYIRRRVREHARSSVIAQELNDLQLPPSRCGTWTAGRVNAEVARMRRGLGGGLDPVAAKRPVSVSRSRRPITPSRADQSRNAELEQLWGETANVEVVTRRADELGIRTRFGNRFTPNDMARKLASLGLRQPEPRRRRPRCVGNRV